MTRYAAAVGYNAPEYAITIHGLNNLKTFSASYYHRVSPDVEAGAKAVYDSKSTHGGVALEVGAKAYGILTYDAISSYLWVISLDTLILLPSSRPRSTMLASLLSVNDYYIACSFNY